MKPEKRQDERPSTPLRRWGGGCLGVLVLLAVFAFVLPTVLAATPLRNTLLNLAVGPHQLHGSMGSVALSWLSPTRVRDLRLARTDDKLRIRVEQVQLDKSWWQSWWDLPNLGHLVIEQPRIEVVLDEASLAEDTLQPEDTATRGAGRLTISTAVNGAAVRVFAQHAGPPVIVVKDCDMRMRIAQEPGGRILTLEPLVVFDRQELSAELCEQGLQLVAPILADTTELSGEVSLEVTEFQVPLDEDRGPLHSERTRVRGLAQLHHVTAGLKSPLWVQITTIISGILGRELPTKLRIADDTQVAFHAGDGRIFHTGLTFLLPEISDELVWHTSGSVGLDETLDLKLQARLPLTALRDGPLMRKLSEQPLEFQVTGTLDAPQLELPRHDNWLQRAAGILVEEALPEDRPLVNGILDTIGGLLDKPDNASGQEERPLAELIRSGRDAREQRRRRRDTEQNGPLRRLLQRRNNRDSPDNSREPPNGGH